MSNLPPEYDALPAEERALLERLVDERTAEAAERYRAYLAEAWPEKARLLELDAAIAKTAPGFDRDLLAAEAMSLLRSVGTWWWMLVSRGGGRSEVHHCGKRVGEVDPRVRFRYLCSQRWSSLAETEDERVRHCGECGEAVHWSDSTAEVREHALAGRCVAVPSRLVSAEIGTRTHGYMGQPDGFGMWMDAIFGDEGS